MGEHDYLRSVWRRWVLCLILPAAVGGAAYAACSLMTEWYEGKSTVLVASIVYNGESINLRGTSSADLVGCFTARGVLEEVGTQLDLASQCGVDLPSQGEGLLTVSAPRGSNHVVIAARMPSAQLAQEVAVAIAEEGVARYKQAMVGEYKAILAKLQADATEAAAALNFAEGEVEEALVASRPDTLQERVQARRKLFVEQESRILVLRTDQAVQEAQLKAYEKILREHESASRPEYLLAGSPPLKQALAELDKARLELGTFRVTSRVDTIKLDLALERELASARKKNRAQLLTKQAGAKEQTRSFQESLSGQKPTLELRRKLVSDPAFQQSLAKLTGKDLKDLLALNMSETAANEIYVVLKSALASAQAQEKGYAAQLAAVDQADQASREKLGKLESDTVVLERQEAKLTLRQTLATKRVHAAADALAEDSGVITPVYLDAIKTVVATKSKLAGIGAELPALDKACKDIQTALADLEEASFAAERARNLKQYLLTHAQKAAAAAAQSLQAARSVPTWPPISLSIAPAGRPVTPVAPRRVRLAATALVIATVLTWGLAIFLDQRKKHVPA